MCDFCDGPTRARWRVKEVNDSGVSAVPYARACVGDWQKWQILAVPRSLPLPPVTPKRANKCISRTPVVTHNLLEKPTPFLYRC